MNIIKHFENLISNWQNENKCGYCWKFIGAGRPDLFNMFTDIDNTQCCIYVGLFKITFGTIYRQQEQGFTSKDYCYVRFEGFIGIPSLLDVQFYNELGNTDAEKEQSKWEILNNIKECLGCEFLEMLCDDSGQYAPASFSAEQKLNYQDNNYDGWLIKGQYNY